MYQISKQFHFSGSHAQAQLPADNPCRRLHGHNYVLEIVLRAEELNEVGFVVDYKDLRPLKEYIDDEFDHRHLNDVIGDITSVEALCKHFYEWCKERWPQTYAIRISETPKTWAEYRPS
jgi:6-pyruvoyltetrahydropterin/6-carboxytetrahydropterin synthase